MWLLLYKFKILFVVGEGAASHLSEYRASRQCVCLYEKKKKYKTCQVLVTPHSYTLQYERRDSAQFIRVLVFVCVFDFALSTLTYILSFLFQIWDRNTN